QIDPLARRELAFFVLPRAPLFAAACIGIGMAPADLFQSIGHRKIYRVTHVAHRTSQICESFLGGKTALGSNSTRLPARPAERVAHRSHQRAAGAASCNRDGRE